MSRALAVSLAAALVAAAQPAPAAAQAGTRRDTIAFAGAAGVYVWTGGTVVSRAHPVNGVALHRIERRRPGTTDWQRIADVEAIDGPGKLFAPLDSTLRAAVRRGTRQKTDQGTWDYIVRFPRADSLSTIIGLEPVRLALGIYGLDRDVRAGDTWEYRVTDVDAQSRAGRAVLSAPVKFPAEVRLAPVSTARVEESDSIAVVWWLFGSGHLGRSLEIWRRRAPNGAFERIDSLGGLVRRGDSLLARYADRRVTPGAIYEYFAVPRDIFFNRGTPSDTVTVYTVDFVRAGSPDTLAVDGVDTLGIVVRWHLPHPDLVRSVRVYRSTAQDRGFELVAEVPAREGRYVDARVDPMRLYYYRVSVTGPRNEESPRSAALFGYLSVRQPPAPPQALRAAPEGAGVRLRWLPNAETDLKGYYVYRTDMPFDTLRADTPLALVSGLVPAADTTFLDTLSRFSPGREYTYVVQAVNSSNLASAVSEPAFFAPASAPETPAPTTLHGWVDGTTVQLIWDDMVAVVPTVAGYAVLRRTAAGPDTSWTVMTPTPLGAAQNSWRDTTGVAGRRYRYLVRAVDLTGRPGPPSAPFEIAIPLGRPQPPGNLRAAAAATGVTLAWDEVQGLTGTVRVYRYRRGEAARLLGEVPLASRAFADRTAARGQLYFYYVTVVAGGVEGERSPELSVRP